MIEPEVLSAAIWPTFIIVLVATAAIWAQAFVRLIFGARVVVDKKSGITVSWLQVGWMAFFWVFMFAGFWPLVDILAEPDWSFGEFLYMTLGALLLFATAYVLAPDGTYAEADGESRFQEIAPLFFGLLAVDLIWLVVYSRVIRDGPVALDGIGIAAIVLTVALALIKNLSFQKIGAIFVWAAAAATVIGHAVDIIDETLVDPEFAPIQGGIITIWLASAVLSVLLLVMITMAQVLNRHSGFRPYGVHAAWSVWLFGWTLLIWWRSPLLVTEGWEFHHFLFFSLAPLLLSLFWIFIMPTATGGSAEAARTQYYEKAPQAFSLLALLAVWAIVMNAWLLDDSTATAGIALWAAALVLFLVISRTKLAYLHIIAAVFAWGVLITEFAFDLDRGLPAL
jgi:hypothetical protein